MTPRVDRSTAPQQGSDKRRAGTTTNTRRSLSRQRKPDTPGQNCKKQLLFLEIRSAIFPRLTSVSEVIHLFKYLAVIQQKVLSIRATRRGLDFVGNEKQLCGQSSSGGVARQRRCLLLLLLLPALPAAAAAAAFAAAVLAAAAAAGACRRFCSGRSLTRFFCPRLLANRGLIVLSLTCCWTSRWPRRACR